MILVERGVHGRNLRLTKRLVKGVVDELRCDSKTRCRVAIVNKRRLKPAILLIGIHIGEAWQLSHLLKQLRSPFHQIVQIVTLNRVLKLSIALAPADPQVLASLQKNGCTGNRRQLGPQAVDDIA